MNKKPPEVTILSQHFFKQAKADYVRFKSYEAMIEPHRTDAQKEQDFKATIQDLRYEID